MHFPRTFFVCCLSTLLLLSCNEAADSPYPPIHFEQKASIPDHVGRASSVAFAVGAKGYVTLGRSDILSDSLKDCWEYDPAANSWTKKAPFPGVARVKAMAAVLNGKAYVGLGFQRGQTVYSTGNMKDFYMFDPQVDKWFKKASFPASGSNACASFVYGGEIYVCSGFASWGFTAQMLKYNPDQDKWIDLADFPGEARSGGVICADNQHVYFGTGYATLNENDWWEYFPANNTWVKRDNMPDRGRINALGLSISNRYFVTTGRYFAGKVTGGGVKSDIMEFDAAKNVWYKRGELPASGRESAISFTINGKGYIGMGENDFNTLNDFWCFEP